MNNSLEKRFSELSLKELSDQLYVSASSGILEEIQYILTSPDLKNKPKIDHANDRSLVVASSNGHTTVVKYLLNFSNYGDQITTNYALTKACLYNQIDLAKFLLDSDEIPHKANIHAKNDYIFGELLIAKNKEILSYLIFDRNISKTESINFYLNKNHYNNNGFVSEIKGLFELRELNKELHTELPIENISNSKKIKL